jgi:hypothetical protein
MSVVRRVQGKQNHFGLLLLVLLVVCCLASFDGLAGDPPILGPPLWEDQDNHPIPKPKKREASELYAIVHNSFLRHFNLVRHLNAGPALNVNAWDEVPDSSWFTNRMGRKPMIYQEILGSLEGVGPKSGKWRIARINDVGYTPKLDIV